MYLFDVFVISPERTGYVVLFPSLLVSTSPLIVIRFDLPHYLTLLASPQFARREYTNCQFVSGSDDFQLRVYNISTGEKITSFEAHPDYIRCLTVHPTLPLVLTGSDDMTVKCWDWDKGWRCVQVGPSLSHVLSFMKGCEGMS
jgi:WD40 repeat protein